MNSSKKERLITPLQPVQFDLLESQRPVNTMANIPVSEKLEKDNCNNVKTVACMLGCACGLSTVIVTGIFPLFS